MIVTTMDEGFSHIPKNLISPRNHEARLGCNFMTGGVVLLVFTLKRTRRRTLKLTLAWLRLNHLLKRMPAGTVIPESTKQFD